MSTRNNLFSSQERGFTLIELLVVIAIIGLLAAIAAPSWLSYTNRTRLNQSQSQIYRALMAAKSNAIRDKITWQASFRENNGKVQWVIHPADTHDFISPSIWNNEGIWQDLESGVNIDWELNNKGKSETTFNKDKIEQLWRVQFNHHGCAIYKPGNDCLPNALGRISLKNSNGGDLRRCVIISTILGVMRRGKENAKPDSTDKYCH